MRDARFLAAGFLFLALARPAGAAGPRKPAIAPTSVTIASDFQHLVGCAGDWDPACAASHLTYDATDDVWQRTFTIPAGTYHFKAALNDSWTENYGANAQPGGANIDLPLATDATVKFYYDDKTHWVTSNLDHVIATAAGDFQSELGCPGDWQPDCLRSWLEDPTGSGTYSLSATLPAGNYQGKVAINEAWTENYGVGGTPGGANYAFTVPAGGGVTTFSYDPVSHVLTITAPTPVELMEFRVE